MGSTRACRLAALVLATSLGCVFGDELVPKISSLVVCTSPKSPMSHCTPGEATNGKNWTGFSIQLWRMIAADPTINLPEADPAGFTWRCLHHLELVKEIDNGRCDIGIGGINISPKYHQKWHFSAPTYKSGLQILVPRVQGPGTVPPFKWLDVFDWSLWLVVLSTTVGASILISVFEGLNENNADWPTASLGWLLFEGLWNSSQILLSLGTDKSTKTWPARIVQLAWMLAVLILTATYTASLASDFTVSAQASSIKGPKDLAAKLVVTTKEYEPYVLRERALTTIMPLDGDQTVMDMVAMLENGQADAVVLSEPVLHWAAAQNCSVQVVTSPWVIFYTGIAFQRNRTSGSDADLSLISHKIDSIVVAMLEDGRLQSLADTAIHNIASHCPASPTTGFTAYQMRGLFYLMAAAVVLAVALALGASAICRFKTVKAGLTLLAPPDPVAPQPERGAGGGGNRVIPVAQSPGEKEVQIRAQSSLGEEDDLRSMLRAMSEQIAELRREQQRALQR